MGGKQAAELLVTTVGGVDGIGAHRFGTGGSGTVAVVHGHQIDPIQPHAGIEGLAHHRQPFPGQPLGQHWQGVPEFQVGVALLQQAEGGALQEVGFGVGDGGAFDIEIEAIQGQGVDGVAIGGRQGSGTAASGGEALGLARACGPSHGHHHVTTGGPQLADFAANRHGLGVGAGQRQGR